MSKRALAQHKQKKHPVAYRRTHTYTPIHIIWRRRDVVSLRFCVRQATTTAEWGMIKLGGGDMFVFCARAYVSLRLHTVLWSSVTTYITVLV